MRLQLPRLYRYFLIPSLGNLLYLGRPQDRNFRYSPFPIFLKIMNQTTSILNQKLTTFQKRDFINLIKYLRKINCVLSLRGTKHMSYRTRSANAGT